MRQAARSVGESAETAAAGERFGSGGRVGGVRVASDRPQYIAMRVIRPPGPTAHPARGEAKPTLQ